VGNDYLVANTRWRLSPRFGWSPSTCDPVWCWWTWRGANP